MSFQIQGQIPPYQGSHCSLYRLCEMGCYGLGVTRILAAALEVLSSEEEIRWPPVIAPYQVCIITAKVRITSIDAALLWQKEASDIPSKSESLMFSYFT